MAENAHNYIEMHFTFSALQKQLARTGLVVKNADVMPSYF